MGENVGYGTVRPFMEIKWMNKFKLLINNCQCEINSLLDRVRDKEITHIIVTTNGTKIKCYESIELFSDEIKIIVAKCLVGMKDKIITINDDNVEYILEKYNNDVWNQVMNIANIDNVDEKTDDRNYV